MDQDSTSPPAMEAQWYYLNGAQRCGPVPQGSLQEMLRSGSVPPGVQVWREGLPDWLPADSVPELTRAPGGPGAAPPQMERARRRRSNAKINCITMFVIFGLGVQKVIMLVVRGGTPEDTRAAMSGSLGGLIVIGAVYAAIYVPLRWRVIMAQSPPIRALGLIGGLGLIAFLALTLLVAAIGAVAG